MTECYLLEENGRAHFMTKRFDREGNQTKHHIQTLCGINHFDYNNMFAYSYVQIIDDINDVVKNWSDFALKVNVSDYRHSDIKSNLHVLNI